MCYRSFRGSPASIELPERFARGESSPAPVRARSLLEVLAEICSAYDCSIYSHSITFGRLTMTSVPS